MNKIISSNPKENSLVELLRNNELMLLEVRANWCGGSHIIAPVIKKIEDEFNSTIKIVRMDYDSHREFLYKNNVNSIPVILLVKEGKVINRIDGTISRGNLKNLVLELLNC
jgi:thioredoxin 1